MAREAYFSIGHFSTSTTEEITSTLARYAYVIPVTQGMLSADLRLGLVVDVNSEKDRSHLALAHAANLPTLTLHRRLVGVQSCGPHDFHVTSPLNMTPFISYALALSIVGNPEIATVISQLTEKWRCGVRSAEVLALLVHTGSIDVMSDAMGLAPTTVKSHIRRIIKNAVACGEDPRSGQDLLRIMLWELHGAPKMAILPKHRKVSDPDVGEEDEDE